VWLSPVNGVAQPFDAEIIPGFLIYDVDGIIAQTQMRDRGRIPQDIVLAYEQRRDR
jgi:hypothetical protein